jgi:hypothetical protein
MTMNGVRTVVLSSGILNGPCKEVDGALEDKLSAGTTSSVTIRQRLPSRLLQGALLESKKSSG